MSAHYGVITVIAQYRYRNANERMLLSFNDVGQRADPERVPRNAAFRLLARHKSELTGADCKYAAGLRAALRNYSNVVTSGNCAWTAQNWVRRQRAATNWIWSGS